MLVSDPLALAVAVASGIETKLQQVPVLTYERDAPGLALGYQLPAMRLAITVVK